MPESLTITILGAGALGTFYAAWLSDAGLDVTLVCRERDVERLKKGVRVTGLRDLTAYPRIAAIPPASDLALVTVKTYDIATAARSIPLTPETLVAVIHNGLGGDDAAAAILGPGHVGAGVSYCGITFLEPGLVRLAGFRELVLGSVEPAVAARLAPMAEALARTGLNVRFSGDIRAEQWEKLSVNVGINAITALTGLPNGELTKDSGLRQLVAEAVHEAVRVSEALGIHPRRDPLENTFAVIEETGGNRSSMLQDIRKGKRTEIDAINGAISDLGSRHGIPTPVNDTLAALIRGLERGTGAGDSGNAPHG